MSKRHSWWSITINNPSDEDRLALRKPIRLVKEMWYQDEVGAHGTTHIQGCINTSQTRFSTLKEWLPTAHIEAARNKDALIQYCQKSETAVDNSFIHYSTKNEIIDPEEEGEVPDLSFTLTEILLMLAAQVTEEDDLSEPQDLYSDCVNRLVLLLPHMTDKFTRQNVYSSWRVTYMSFLKLVARIRERVELDDVVSQSVSLGECLIHPECNCDKDHCDDCVFWETYQPDIISLVV